jgi:hypothetical protein
VSRSKLVLLSIHSLVAVRGNSSKTTPGYEIDGSHLNPMPSLLSWLDSGVTIIPTVESLMAAGEDFDGVALGSGGLADFARSRRRLPAPGEKPPADYAGDPDLFREAGHAVAMGCYLVKDTGLVAVASVGSQKCYLTRLVPTNGRLVRLPWIPATDRGALNEWMAVCVNRFLVQEQRFVREHRKTNARPVIEVAERHARGRSAPTSEEVADRTARIASVVASAVDSQPYESSSSEGGGSSGDDAPSRGL